MDQVSANLENELIRNTRDAKNIMLLSLIGIVVPPLFLVALLYFLLYSNKRNKLKNDQSLSHIFNGLKDKATKELRSITRSSNSLENRAAGSIHAHKTLVAVLIIIGIVLTLMIAYIGLAYKMGWV
jgi:anaerobic C4-dicarboxylate transporter